MGKYMRKAKISGEVAVMEVAAHQPSLGVCTRARALAASAAARESSAYLELRSRRLEKPLPPSPAFKGIPKSNPGPKPTSQKASSASTSNSVSAGSSRTNLEKPDHADVEVSLGENALEHESRRRETTPCSPIRESETMETPGSTTRSTYSTSAKQRMQNTMSRNIPTAREMEEFFMGIEKLQQQMFIEKYNFDPVNDHPLPGRYEWVKLD
ncbi:cyclin-dependent kinase inhibitor 4-like [Canna indica]|uniref:Cyclin-dependent kinase inhibitor n=1 Tax=Canna indica TaxID=4628 RepID=A0AAQ3KEB6_9LILI|nr:cyclin-dependent kinase inhibitor 4-like [Canna indica]